jgi:acyl-CoA thioesterase FadM
MDTEQNEVVQPKGLAEVQPLEVKMDPVKLPPIVKKMGILTQENVDAFATATRTEFFASVPPTYQTIFRDCEFDWLDRLQLDMKQLLHTEQEYEYLVPLKVGDDIEVSTKVLEFKERKGLKFFTLETRILASSVLTILARSTFIVRKEGGS